MSIADNVELRFLASGKVIKFFESVSITSDFLNPLDEWRMVVSDDKYSLYPTIFIPGSKIQIAINNRVQLTGYLEGITQQDGQWELSGRNFLGPVCDSQVDPTLVFAKGSTLKSAVLSVLAPFGITRVDISDKDNQKVIANQVKTDDDEPDPTAKAFKDLKPKKGQGNWEYLEKILKRKACWLWARADGAGVVVAKPNFETVNMPGVYRNLLSNVEKGSKRINFQKQPSCVIMYNKGVSEDGETTKNQFASIATNELVGTNLDGSVSQGVIDVLSKPAYSSAVKLNMDPQLIQYRKLFSDLPSIKPLFIFDKTSATLEESQNVCRRTLAELQRQALEVTYTVQGFGQEDKLWAVNNCVSIKDEILDLKDPLYLFKRTFNQSRTSGTTTDLTFILPKTINLSPA